MEDDYYEIPMGEWAEVYGEKKAEYKDTKAAALETTLELREAGFDDEKIGHFWQGIDDVGAKWGEWSMMTEKDFMDYLREKNGGYFGDRYFDDDEEDDEDDEDNSDIATEKIPISFSIMTSLNSTPGNERIRLEPDAKIDQKLRSTNRAVVGFSITDCSNMFPYAIKVSAHKLTNEKAGDPIRHPLILLPSLASKQIPTFEGYDLISDGRNVDPHVFDKYSSAEDIIKDCREEERQTQTGDKYKVRTVPLADPLGFYITTNFPNKPYHNSDKREPYFEFNEGSLRKVAEMAFQDCKNVRGSFPSYKCLAIEIEPVVQTSEYNKIFQNQSNDSDNIEKFSNVKSLKDINGSGSKIRNGHSIQNKKPQISTWIPPQLISNSSSTKALDKPYAFIVTGYLNVTKGRF